VLDRLPVQRLRLVLRPPAQRLQQHLCGQRAGAGAGHRQGSGRSTAGQRAEGSRLRYPALRAWQAFPGGRRQPAQREQMQKGEGRTPCWLWSRSSCGPAGSGCRYRGCRRRGGGPTPAGRAGRGSSNG
jgi:hypothetical protein